MAHDEPYEAYEKFRDAVQDMKQVFRPEEVLQALQDEWEAFVITLNKDELPPGLLTGLEMIGREDIVGEIDNQKRIN